ncbi:MAG: hypothetical protein MR293_03570 [Bacteroidales bacterium]|nr:hypothetical protein [Bacteroidales bacterium]
MHNAKQICCMLMFFLLSISNIQSQTIKRDTLLEDFSSAEWMRYSNYTSAVLTTQNNITWHFENMQVAQVGKLTSKGLVYYYNAGRASGGLTTSKIKGLRKITFEAARKGNITFSVSYSKDGTNWTTAFDLTLTTTMILYTIELPQAGDYYINFGVTKATTGTYLYLDNISFYTEETDLDYGEPMDIVDWTENSLTLNMNGCAPEQGVAVGLNGSAEQPIEEGNRYSFSGKNDRTYCISAPALQSGEDLQLSVQYGDYQGNKYESNRRYRIPYLYQDATVSKLSFRPDDDIVVRGKTTITANANVAVRNVYVYPGGELIVNNGYTLLCANLFLRTTANQSAAASGQIKAHHTYYTRIVADKTHYFQLALPAKSPVRQVVTTAGDTCLLDKHWRLNTYDTQLRAEQGTTTDNWVRFTGDTLQACQGYAMLSASPYYREYLFPISPAKTASTTLVVPTQAPKGDIDAQHDGWNYLCSPYRSVYICTPASDIADRIYISELRPDGNSYWQHIADTIYPAKPFYYQSATSGNLVFGEMLHFESTVNQSVAAPMLQTDSAAETTTQWLQLMLQDSLGQIDESHIYLHPTRFAAGYQIGKDLLKLRGTGAHLLLYAIMPYGDLSVCATADSTAERQINIGCYFAANGKHTIRLHNQADTERLAEVLLVDNQANTQTDLLQEDYTFTASQGESKDRFALRCVFRQKATPTRIDTDSRVGVATKFLRCGQLFIVRQGGVYDALGRKAH